MRTDTASIRPTTSQEPPPKQDQNEVLQNVGSWAVYEPLNNISNIVTNNNPCPHHTQQQLPQPNNTRVFPEPGVHNPLAAYIRQQREDEPWKPGHRGH